MRTSFQTPSLKAIILLAIVAYGCREETDISAVTGSISGEISPDNAAVRVIATPASGATVSITPEAGGNFTFTNLAPEDYIVTIEPAAGYGQASAISVPVTAGKSSDIGTIVVPVASTTGTVSFIMDGMNFTFDPPYTFCIFNSPNFLVGGQTGPPINNYLSLSVILNKVTGPGIYEVGSGINSMVQLIQYKNNKVYKWSTIKGGNGTVNVITLNTTTRLCTGTFSANLVPENSNADGKKAIANGSFANMKF